MKIELIPKRKLSRQEAEVTVVADSLDYLANTLEQKLASTSLGTDLSAHAADTSTHGVTVAVVGTTDTQTLTNKTLTSPALTTPAITSPTINSGGTITGLGTGTSGFILKNLKNSSASALSGTQLDIAVDIGGTPYYFTVYPTKA